MARGRGNNHTDNDKDDGSMVKCLFLVHGFVGRRLVSWCWFFAYLLGFYRLNIIIAFRKNPFQLSGWMNTVMNKYSPSPTPPSSSYVTRRDRIGQPDSVNGVAQDVVKHDSQDVVRRDL